jgi:NADH dehydrogenase FAD-containing subunit
MVPATQKIDNRENAQQILVVGAGPTGLPNWRDITLR